MSNLPDMTADEYIEHLRRQDIISYRLECQQSFKKIRKAKKKIEGGARNEDTGNYAGRLCYIESMNKIKLLNIDMDLNNLDAGMRDLSDGIIDNGLGY